MQKRAGSNLKLRMRQTGLIMNREKPNAKQQLKRCKLSLRKR